MPTLADIFRGVDVAAGGVAQGIGMMNELRFKQAIDEKKRAADFEDQKKLLEFKDQLERKQLEFEIDKIRKSYGEYGDNFQPDVSGLDPGQAGQFITALPKSKSKADKFQAFVLADLLKPNQRAKMKVTQETIKYKDIPIGTRPKVEYTIEEISAQEQAATTTNESDRLAGEALQTEFEQSTMPMTPELKAQTLPSFIQMAARKREGLQAEAKRGPVKADYEWVKTSKGEVIEVEKGKAPAGAVPYEKSRALSLYDRVGIHLFKEQYDPQDGKQQGEILDYIQKNKEIIAERIGGIRQEQKAEAPTPTKDIPKEVDARIATEARTLSIDDPTYTDPKHAQAWYEAMRPIWTKYYKDLNEGKKPVEPEPFTARQAGAIKAQQRIAPMVRERAKGDRKKAKALFLREMSKEGFTEGTDYIYKD